MDFFYQLQNFILILYLCLSYIFVIAYIFFANKQQEEDSTAYTGGISVLIPSYNEIHTIQSTIESVIKSKHDFNLEIIVIDDGVESETCTLLRQKFPFKVCRCEYKKYIKTNTVKCIYYCKICDVPVFLIDKEHGCKADALNTAINLAHYDYSLCLDADSFLDNNALTEMHKSIHTNTLAIGGKVQPYLAKEDRLLAKFLTIAQIYEYARIFNIVRVAYNNLHIVPLISGAISLFHTQTVKTLGGYDRNTIGEDFELTLRLQNYAKDHGGEIQYCNSSIVYTQVPFDLVSIVKQRTRWYQGMVEVFKKYKNLFYTKSTFSVALHFIRLYEQYGFIFEIALAINYCKYLLIILSIEIIFNFAYTLYAQYKSNQKALINLFCLSIFGIAFHFLNTAIKLLYYFRKKRSSWEFCTRRPHETI